MKYDSLVAQFEIAKKEYDEQEQMLSKNRSDAKILRQFISDFLGQHEPIDEFDTRLWGSMVDFITVYSKDDIRVTFIDGTEIKA